MVIQLFHFSLFWFFVYLYSSCNIPKDEFLDAVQFVLKSTFFSFDNQIYKQNYGTPMGSPLSPIIADIVMQDLEREAGDL